MDQPNNNYNQPQSNPQTPQPQYTYQPQQNYNGGQQNAGGQPYGGNQQYGGGQQYNPGGQYGGQNDQMIPPNNYLAFAIFTTICCCLPTGIYAIIRSTKVNTYFHMGQYDLAYEASQDAKKWSTIGLIAGLVINVLYIILYALGVVAGLNS